jgi:YVTN family beta-propeller protein
MRRPLLTLQTMREYPLVGAKHSRLGLYFYQRLLRECFALPETWLRPVTRVVWPASGSASAYQITMPKPASCRLLSAACLLLSACSAPPPSPIAQSTASSLALSPDGTVIAAVNPDSDSVTLVNADSLTVIAEVAVGDEPKTLAFTPANDLLVVNGGDGTLMWIRTGEWAKAMPSPASLSLGLGTQPYGVAVNANFAFVSLRALGQIAMVDLAQWAVVGRVNVEPFPTGLALAGDALYVTHLHSARVTKINLSTQQIVWVASTTPEGNIAPFVALSPDGARAYVPHTRSNAGNPALDYDSIVYPVISFLDTANGALIETLALDQVDRPASLPLAVAPDDAGQTLFVAYAGSDDVAALNLATRSATARFTVGSHPTALATDPARDRLYVNNTLSGALSVITLPATIQTLTLTTIPLDPQILRGKQVFNASLGSLSKAHWIACAACHFEGGADARTWLGFPDGPRNTPALGDAGQTGPWHWSGDLDEVQDVELTIRHIQHGAGLIAGAVDKHTPPNAGRSADLDALAAYVGSLTLPLSPYNQADGALSPAALRGQGLFHQLGCVACHPPPLYTDRQLHLSTIGDAALERNPRGLQMDTPSLLGAWATAPYFHDGSAPTLRDTLFRTGAHSIGVALTTAQADDLAAFLQSLPTTSVAPPVATPPASLP